MVRDPRLLGGVELDPDESVLGPDALAVTPAQLRRALEHSDVALKARLMDQHRLAGVGNLIADEVLWRASLDSSPTFRLTDAGGTPSTPPSSPGHPGRHDAPRRVAPRRPHARADRSVAAAPVTGPSSSARRSGAGPAGGAPATSTDRTRRRTPSRQSPSSARTFSAWPSAFTWYQARRTLPSGPTRKVERITPTDFLPYSVFSPQAP